MDCVQLQDLAEHGLMPLEHGNAEAREHLAQCTVCNELFGGQAELGSALLAARDDFSLDESFAELEQLLAREEQTRLGRLRSLATPVRRGLVVGAGLLVCLGTYALWRRPDFASYPAWRMLLVLGSLLAAGAVAASEVLRPLSVPRAARSERALTSIALALPFVFALLPAAECAHPASAGSGNGLRPALLCLAIGITAAMPSLGLIWLLDRWQLPPLSQRILVAGCGGLFANAMLQLHCPFTGSAHLVAGHALVGVLLLAFTLPRLR